MVQVTFRNTTLMRYIKDTADPQLLPFEFLVIQKMDYEGIVPSVPSQAIDTLKVRTRLRKEIPGQYQKQDEEEKMDDWDILTLTMLALVAFVVVENIILNLFIGIALQYLWGMIACLQLMVHMVLINLLYPANIQKVFITFMQIVSFEAYDTSEFFEDNLKLTHTEAVNTPLEMLGYESQNFIINSGLCFVVFMASLLGLAFIGICFMLEGRHVVFARLYRGLKNTLIWNFFIRLLLEGYIDLALASIIQIKNLNINGFGDAISFSTGFSVLHLVVLFPFVCLAFLKTNFKKLDSMEVRKTYGSIYTGLRVDSVAALMYPLSYQLRRLMLCVIVLFMDKFNYFQIQALLQMQVFVIIYSAWVLPFETMLMNI